MRYSVPSLSYSQGYCPITYKGFHGDDVAMGLVLVSMEDSDPIGVVDRLEL